MLAPSACPIELAVLGIYNKDKQWFNRPSTLQSASELPETWHQPRNSQFSMFTKNTFHEFWIKKP